MIERLQATYGFTRMPFGRDLAPQMLHRHTAHAEAVARITWGIDQHALGVPTGEVGVGKTVAARAAMAALDPTRHTLIYLPNPTVGTRGIHHAIVCALGGTPRPHRATLIPQATDALATEHAERGRTPCWSSTKPTCSTTTSSKASACSPTTTLTAHPRSPACWSASPPCAAGSNSACSLPSTSASPCATTCPA